MTKYKKSSGPKERPEVVAARDRDAVNAILDQDHTREVAYRNYPCCTLCRSDIKRLREQNKQLEKEIAWLREQLRAEG